MYKFLISAIAIITGITLIGRQLRRLDREKRTSEHVSETEAAYRNASTRILILGGGFGGLSTALKLDQHFGKNSESSVLVVERNNDLLFTPLLWTVANGRTNPNNAVVPIRDFQKGRQFHVLHAEIESIDLDHRQVQTSAGHRPYDQLVIALGSYTMMPNLPGLRTYALPFHTPSDALQLRNHLIDAIESAHQNNDEQERRAWLTFVVGGAGDTGVELAATIHDYITTGLFNTYPWLADTPVRIVVIGRAPRVLPTSNIKTADLVQHVLEQEGIEVLTGREITAITETTVETNFGVIHARSFFWAAGITPPYVVCQLPVQHARNGAIIVDDYLRIPEYPEVFVIGDSAWAYDSVTHAPVPATAQAARQQGYYVGDTIAAENAHKPVQPYRYAPLGHLALLGHYRGVAEIALFTFDGPTAWILWHLVYLWRNPSWRKRIRLLVDWLLSGLLGRETAQLRLNAEQSQHDKVLV